MISSDLAYIVHSRPYRETSQLVTALGREHGRVPLVFKGARRGKRPPAQPFSLLQLSWSGRTDLKTLRQLEVTQYRHLAGRNLYVGLYLNELLSRILRDGQPVTPLFDRYHHLMQRLDDPGVEVEPLLRSFEYSLLQQMGYGFALDRDARSGDAVTAGQMYAFDPDQGLFVVSGREKDGDAYRGEHLLAMAAMDYSDPRVRSAAKRLMREALQPHLGSRPLLSRELFRGHIGGGGVE